MLLAQIPAWGWIAMILVLEACATLWFMSSLKRSKTEKVSIKLERVTYIMALICGAIGLIGIAVLPLIIRSQY